MISDDGHVVFARYDGASVWNPMTKELEVLAEKVDHGCLFRSNTELVCPDGGSVRVVSL